MNIIQLGDFTLIHADNLKVLPKMADKQFDWLFDDPPYGTKEDAFQKIKRVAKTKKYQREVFKQPIPSQWYFNQAFRVSKNQIIWGINYFAGVRKGFASSGRVVWDKVNQETNWSDCELAYCSAHHTIRLFRFMWNGMMQGTSLLNGTKMQGNKKLNQQRIHDTEKPIELYKWQFLKYVKPGSSVLDCHGGSMSILIAAHYLNTWHNYNLRVTIIEKHRPTFDDAVKRFLPIYNQMAIRPPDPDPQKIARALSG